MSALTFNDEAHEYRLGGAVIPSVTDVIGTVMPSWQADDWYKDRGKAVHLGCQFLDENRLDWSSVDEREIAPRIRAWQRFRDEWPAEVTGIETPLVSLRYRFAGKLDRTFERESKCTIADIKNGIEPQVLVQLGGYSLLWSENTEGRRAFQGVAVELREDETYSAKWFPSHQLRLAEQTFLACLSVFNFMRSHNLKGNGNGNGTR